MKKTFLILIAFLTLNAILTFAHDFEVNGIYYNFLGGDSVAVTYRGNSYYSYSDEYEGSVSIPETVSHNSIIYRVTTIGNNAFDGCSGLTSITIPNSVTTIGNDAFGGCYGLTTITIPNSVTTIGEYAFSRCSSLTTITIPNSVTTIGEYAFSLCSSLTTITIPNSVTTIGKGAFYDCSSLTAITIPNSVTTIGDGAFRGFSNVETISVESGNPTYHSAGNCLIETASKTLILGCKNSVIPTDGSVTTIGNNAFYGCSGLISITIPNSVTTIGEGAFDDCSSLTEITIPNNVTTIDNYAFYGCSNLTSVTIGNSVTTIGDRAFYDCSNVEAISVESSNPTYHSAGNCLIETASKTLILGCKNSIIPTDGSVTTIGKFAFTYCSGLTSITIPNSVTTIGECAFASCDNLTSITIPNSVTTIGESAFSGCTSLTSITIPNSVTTIGERAFSVCTSLTSITIPNSVTTIGEYAFSRCSSLTTITIPNSVTTIGECAFAFCDNLTSITLRAAIPPTITEDTFYRVYNLREVIVPCGSASLYHAATNWSGYKYKINEGLVYDFKVSSQDEATGFVQTIQEPSCTQPAIFEAIAMDGYRFQIWSDGNTQAARQIEVTEDIDLQALFVPVDGSGDVTGVTIIPSDSTAAFTWPAVEGAASYTLIVWADENETERICTLTFDATGRLTNIDFSKHKAPAKNTAAGFGLNFTVTGLDAGTTYGYTLDSKTSEGVVLHSKSGTFETTGETGIEDIFTPTANDSARKVLENGAIYILRNGEKYAIDGRRIM